MSFDTICDFKNARVIEGPTNDIFVSKLSDDAIVLNDEDSELFYEFDSDPVNESVFCCNNSSHVGFTIYNSSDRVLSSLYKTKFPVFPFITYLFKGVANTDLFSPFIKFPIVILEPEELREESFGVTFLNEDEVLSREMFSKVKTRFIQKALPSGAGCVITDMFDKSVCHIPFYNSLHFGNDRVLCFGDEEVPGHFLFYEKGDNDKLLFDTNFDDVTLRSLIGCSLHYIEETDSRENIITFEL